MRQSGFHILRVGIGITFLWIGVLILKDTNSFSALIEPWVLNIIGHFTNNVDKFLQTMMIEIAFFDLAVGFLLLINRFVFLAALLGALHLLTILTSTAILATVRDIGLLSATVALMLNTLPYPFVWPTTLKGWVKLVLS